MKRLEKLGLSTLHKSDPEKAHNLALRALRLGLTPQPGAITSPRLANKIAGLDLPNPIGLAAGFDKNAVALAPLINSGFGFIEVGAATPEPQKGNPRPRLFRLDEDLAAINRFGFNNQGARVIAKRLAKRPATGVIGLNLGANKTSEDRAGDFAKVLQICGPHVDFATVNVSSPNTEKLRDLQGKSALSALLEGVLHVRDTLENPVAVFLKIAPDLSDDELGDIAEVARNLKLDAVIATNTTVGRDGLQSPKKSQSGGLSGQPLFDRSTQILARLSHLLNREIPLIGVGGIGSAEQAYAKIRAGAAAVQLYTALVYGGFSLVGDIVWGLDRLLRDDGYSNVSQAVGVDQQDWL